MSLRNHLVRGLLPLLLGPCALLATGTAAAQSNAVSEASTASLDASIEVPVAAYEALKSGGEFVVTGVQASARGTVMTISVLPAAGSLVLLAMIEPDYNIISGEPRTSLGKAIETSGGLLLELGDRVIAFIPEPRARAHMHSRKLPR